MSHVNSGTIEENVKKMNAVKKKQKFVEELNVWATNLDQGKAKVKSLTVQNIEETQGNKFIILGGTNFEDLNEQTKDFTIQLIQTKVATLTDEIHEELAEIGGEIS